VGVKVGVGLGVGVKVGVGVGVKVGVGVELGVGVGVREDVGLGDTGGVDTLDTAVGVTSGASVGVHDTQTLNRTTTMLIEAATISVPAIRRERCGCKSWTFILPTFSFPGDDTGWDLLLHTMTLRRAKSNLTNTYTAAAGTRAEVILKGDSQLIQISQVNAVLGKLRQWNCDLAALFQRHHRFFPFLAICASQAQFELLSIFLPLDPKHQVCGVLYT